MAPCYGAAFIALCGLVLTILMEHYYWNIGHSDYSHSNPFQDRGRPGTPSGFNSNFLPTAQPHASPIQWTYTPSTSSIVSNPYVNRYSNSTFSIGDYVQSDRTNSRSLFSSYEPRSSLQSPYEVQQESYSMNHQYQSIQRSYEPEIPVTNFKSFSNQFTSLPELHHPSPLSHLNASLPETPQFQSFPKPPTENLFAAISIPTLKVPILPLQTPSISDPYHPSSKFNRSFEESSPLSLAHYHGSMKSDDKIESTKYQRTSSPVSVDLTSSLENDQNGHENVNQSYKPLSEPFKTSTIESEIPDQTSLFSPAHNIFEFHATESSRNEDGSDKSVEEQNRGQPEAMETEEVQSKKFEIVKKSFSLPSNQSEYMPQCIERRDVVQFENSNAVQLVDSRRHFPLHRSLLLDQDEFKSIRSLSTSFHFSMHVSQQSCLTQLDIRFSEVATNPIGQIELFETQPIDNGTNLCSQSVDIHEPCTVEEIPSEIIASEDEQIQVEEMGVECRPHPCSTTPPAPTAANHPIISEIESSELSIESHHQGRCQEEDQRMDLGNAKENFLTPLVLAVDIHEKRNVGVMCELDYFPDETQDSHSQMTRTVNDNIVSPIPISHYQHTHRSILDDSLSESVTADYPEISSDEDNEEDEKDHVNSKLEACNILISTETRSAPISQQQPIEKESPLNASNTDHLDSYYNPADFGDQDASQVHFTSTSLPSRSKSLLGTKKTGDISTFLRAVETWASVVSEEVQARDSQSLESTDPRSSSDKTIARILLGNKQSTLTKPPTALSFLIALVTSPLTSSVDEISDNNLSSATSSSKNSAGISPLVKSQILDQKLKPKTISSKRRRQGTVLHKLPPAKSQKSYLNNRKGKPDKRFPHFDATLSNTDETEEIDILGQETAELESDGRIPAAKKQKTF